MKKFLFAAAVITMSSATVMAQDLPKEGSDSTKQAPKTETPNKDQKPCEKKLAILTQIAMAEDTVKQDKKDIPAEPAKDTNKPDAQNFAMVVFAQDTVATDSTSAPKDEQKPAPANFAFTQVVMAQDTVATDSTSTPVPVKDEKPAPTAFAALYAFNSAVMPQTPPTETDKDEAKPEEQTAPEKKSDEKTDGNKEEGNEKAQPETKPASIA